VGLLIGDLLGAAAAVAPHGIAATLADEEITYSELDSRADRLAAGLAAAGVGHGDVVGWWSPPSLTSIAGFAAAARVGAVFASLNPALADDEARASLEYLQPKLLVVGAGHSERAVEVFNGDVATIDAPGVGPPRDLEDLGRSAGGAGGAPSVRGDDPHIIYMTSGTTGAPKGVVVSHQASWLRAFPGGSTFADGLRGDGGILAAFPLFHYGGWHYVLEAWHHRCALHLSERFDGESLTTVARRRRPSAMYCIPALWERVLQSATAEDLASVLHADTGTSSAPPQLLARLKERMPQASTSVLYGSSEGGHHTTLLDREANDHPGSVGRAAPPGVIRIAEDGEILYRSPTLMTGYLRRPGETRAALRDGWYHTGDLGVMDECGYLYITGRAREVIRTGGEAVSPAEVESALRGYPGMADVAVVGIPDRTWGEVVAAAVVMDAGVEPPAVSDLRAYVGDRLAAFKHPRVVVAIERVPRTPATGQVQRTLLGDTLSAQQPNSGQATSPAGKAGGAPGAGLVGDPKLL
jgi:fatty-acyl-CoA synthase